MLSTILVPLDGSQLSERALPIAEDLARRVSARLLLIRCVQPPDRSAPAATAADVISAEVARRYVDTCVSALAASGLHVEAIVREGEAAGQILSTVHARHVDLIVMTRHGRSQIGRWLVGSVTAGVWRRTPVPLALVPSAGEPIRADERLLVLVALDASALGEAALGVTADLAAQSGARVVLFQAVPPGLAAESASDTELWQARAYLTNVARRLAPVAQRLAVRTASGLPAVAIPQAALETGAALMCLASRGPADPDGVPLGTVATGVLRRTHIPVILVRPDAIRRPPPVAEDIDRDSPDPAKEADTCLAPP